MNMTFKERYERRKPALLADQSICEENREVFRQFFEFEEYKLKRCNQLRELDEPTYNTLYGYIIAFRNVNNWFKNKPWQDLTRDDIKRVYDDLEDGKILNQRGTPFEGRTSYYNKILKSKPFRIAGKSELAKDVIEFSRSRDKVVQFVTEENFRRMVSVVSKPVHLLLFWLAWDIGENIGALLQLRKKDFIKQQNKYTREWEYLVNLSPQNLKRSRQSRSEPTLYPETFQYIEMVLGNLGDEECVFGFGHRQALKIIHGVVKKTGATCMPNNAPVRWKDLRSSMACHLLKCGWSREEVDARLGHTPNSSALNAYINYLAIDRGRPKQKMQEYGIRELQNELTEMKRRERLLSERLTRQDSESDSMRQEIQIILKELHAMQTSLRGGLETLHGRGQQKAQRKSEQVF